MENKGVFKQGTIKKFLTGRSLSPIFKPLMFSKTDYIHLSFINPLMESIPIIQTRTRKELKYIILYWLVQTPRQLFEELFIEGENKNEIMSIATKKAQNKNAIKCTYISQAYSLWYLESMMANDEKFAYIMQISMKELESIIKNEYQYCTETLEYLTLFRNKFNKQEGHSDYIIPKDRILHYILEVCNVLYKDKKAMQKILDEIDKSTRNRLILACFDTAFFSEAKTKTMHLVLNKGV